MKTLVHRKETFQAIRSPSSHLADMRLEGIRGQGDCIDAKNVEKQNWALKNLIISFPQLFSSSEKSKKYNSQELHRISFFLL